MAASMRLMAGVLAVLCGAGSGPALPRAPAAGAIAGRVVDRAKGPLPAAIVTARPLPRGPVREAVSRADGSYRLAGLADGSYEIDAALEGFDITRRRVEVRDGAESGVELTLEISVVCECVDARRAGARATLQGVITDGRGHPLPHVPLTLSSENFSENSYADSAGRFRARVPENRIYELTTDAPGFVSQRTTIRVREAARGIMAVNIDMVADELPSDLPALQTLRYPCACPGDAFVHARK
jgi:carboxypeptidase family protein